MKISKKLLNLAIFISLILSIFMPVYVVANAASPFAQVCSDGQISGGHGLEGNSTVCTDNGSSNPLYGPAGLITKITKIIAIVAGVAAVIMIIISGLLFVTSGGDPQRVATARNTIIYSLVGLLVIALGSLIIEFVVSRIS